MYDNRFFMQCFFSADSISNKKNIKPQTPTALSDVIF